ncbi:MAG: preprotein translocase subunit SecY [Myxococcales bacterium]|nr:preprotein translocase subunit SecY [Myxococcales bacterium]
MSVLANIGKLADLRRRIFFTIGLLLIYRLGVFVTVPGVDRKVMQGHLASGGGGILGVFNLFSGGALEKLSIFALGIMPYISASIILQLLTMVFKPLEELRKEGEQGQRKINQYTRYGTILLSAGQAMSTALYLESLINVQFAPGQTGNVVANPGWGFRLMTVLTLTTGTAFVMWLGEQITERGIGNGISLLIFVGIVTDIPGALKRYYDTNEGNLQPLTLFAVATIILVTVATIVFFERGQRKIPIQYSRRQVGRRIYGGQQAHLPLRVNTAGTIPPIFASSLLMFPSTLANFNIPGANKLQQIVQPGEWVFNAVYVFLIVFFCYFYTAVTFQPVDVADNLKKQQAFIPGIRPGKKTAEYIDRVLTRITLGGSLYVAAVCVIPTIVQTYFRVPFYFGGTSIMIVCGVALDTVQQVEAHLITRNYEGLAGARATKIRGRHDHDEDDSESSNDAAGPSREKELV